MSNEPRTPPTPRATSRLRRFFTRHVPFTIAGAIALLILASIGTYFYLSSAYFQNVMRGRIVRNLAALTGGTVEIRSFHWDLLHLEADISGLVIHGLEGPGEAPWARVDHLHIAISVFDIANPRVLLRDLDIAQPQFHLIVYPDGATNQPHPAHKPKSNPHAIDQLFDLKASRVAVEHGVVDYDIRSAGFDFQDRWAPLDFSASDVSLSMGYVAALPNSPESYHVEIGASDLNLARTIPKARIPPVHGFLQATVDLTRNAAYLRSLRLTAHSRDGKDHALQITGQLNDFHRFNWQLRVNGDLDMRLLDPITGYPNAPQGFARLDLTAVGQAGHFYFDGPVHIDDGAYVGPGVEERGITLDCKVYGTQDRLLIDNVAAQLKQGGEIDGKVDLSPWLPGPQPPPAPHMRAGNSPPPRLFKTKSQPTASQSAPLGEVVAAVHPPDLVIPVSGKVTAVFKNVALDTILDMVSVPPFKRLGMDARVNGTSDAVWTHGQDRSVVVDSMLILSAPNPGSSKSGNEVPTTGVVDATYTQRDGSVAVRNLELHLPQSEFSARGQLGAYPLTSPTNLSVEFHSRNFAEFDTVLRALDLNRNGRAGAAALPVSLGGEADFIGSWTGSVVHPHLAGHLKATNFQAEMPSSGKSSTQPRLIHFDSVEADGSYAAARIAVLHALAIRGPSRITFNGTLDAADGGEPGFNADSNLHLRVKASQLAFDDIAPLLPATIPASGTLDATIEADGPIHSPRGSGTVELSNGSFYGEPLKRLRLEGTLANPVLNISSVTLAVDAGTITASGSYNLRDKSLTGEARSTQIDLSRVAFLHKQNIDAAGLLTASISSSGTLDKPLIEGQATLADLTVGGQKLGNLNLTAHTVGQALNYQISSRFQGAQFALHGQTVLSGDYTTQAQASFSQFNIGAILELAHLESIKGESSLAGTIAIGGPLRDPSRLRGEATLQQLAVTLSGVHLQSQGGAHATLANSRIHLDPLHITGENTDLHAEGQLNLQGARQLDLTASGSINLKLAETLDPDLTASGTTTFQIDAHGSLQHPDLHGRIDFDNGSLSLEDLPNGLSQLHGTLEFNQNRLEVRSLTAMSGGGLLSLGGSLSYQHGIYSNLTVTGKNIRIRYPQGISSLADASLHLDGSQSSLLLSGNVTITRFTAGADLDIAALAEQANSVQTVVSPDAPSNHVRLDVRIVSSPQLNFQNAFAKLAGDVDIRVRGTIASPSLLGRVNITQGSAMIAGTRYELQRGAISFTNPVRIEPVIDLTATARVEDYDITLGLLGPPSRLAVTYRSDPPLPEADVVSLLALGHTANQERLFTQQQEQAITSPSTDALLGGALNATVSNRVQKLFGAGSVKVDPNYLGPFGNSTSRITVQEQIGRTVTLTYATDVNTTGQQLLQAEVAINRKMSLVVARDESGVFSMVVKVTRRYR
ncbi:MAG TPA: translocation/assembly module TamB domain-containing protein [Terracidiphilus sp.]|nr:translocation/assembly module TamB domain-containing protein [Terracidiphilus sp.]